MADILTIRKLADRTDGERIGVHDPITGAKHLLEPDAADALFAAATSLQDFSVRAAEAHSPWPFAGVAIDGEPPAVTTASTGWVDAGVAEGWLERENERVVHRPGGPVEKPWGTTHTFVHADAIVIKTVEGDVRYRVTKQPDKYHDGPAGTDAVGDPTAEVLHFYTLALEV